MFAEASRRPTVSVVIPCHNYGRFFPAALASLDAQDRRPDEVIVCDDGSADDSWSLIERTLRGRADVAAYRHEHPHGIVATFNELVRRSSGDVVVMLSADDVLGPGFLRRMLDDIVERELDFAYCDVVCFGAESWTMTVPELDVDRLARFNYITASAAFRRTLFDAVGGYRASFDSLGFEDYDFWVSAVERGFVGGRVEGCALHWRRHEEGSRNTASGWDRFRLRVKLLRHHPRFFAHPRTLRALRPSVAPVRGREVRP